MPGTLGTMKSMLNPNYVIKEQSYDQGATAGRVADLGPGARPVGDEAAPRLRASARRSRIPTRRQGQRPADPRRPVAREPAQIGAVGVLALLWLFVRAIRRLTPMRQTATRAGRLAGDVARRVDHRRSPSACSRSTRSRSSRSRSSPSSMLGFSASWPDCRGQALQRRRDARRRPPAPRRPRTTSARRRARGWPPAAARAARDRRRACAGGR